jgi:NifU-like protein involved in Fe-S cluster formation
MSSADIYREIILDYYRNPRNFGKLEKFDICSHDTNPLCGDEIDMQIEDIESMILEPAKVRVREAKTKIANLQPEVADDASAAGA